MNNRKYLQGFVFSILFLLPLSCGPGSHTQDHQALSQYASGGRSIRILVLADITGSMTTANVQGVTRENLEKLAETCAANGGELGFGLITGKSENFLRVRFEAPIINKEEPDTSNTNVFLLQKKRHEAQARKDTYLRQKADLDAKNADKTRRFLDTATAMLKTPTARTTDIADPLERAGIFFNENPTPHAFFLIASDGIDETGRQISLNFSPSVKLCMVNSNRSLGILSPLSQRVQLFESTDSAVESIILQVQEHDNG